MHQTLQNFITKAQEIAPELSPTQILAIAKLVCEGIKIADQDICPIVNQLQL